MFAVLIIEFWVVDSAVGPVHWPEVKEGEGAADESDGEIKRSCGQGGADEVGGQ